MAISLYVGFIKSTCGFIVLHNVTIACAMVHGLAAVAPEPCEVSAASRSAFSVVGCRLR